MDGSSSNNGLLQRLWELDPAAYPGAKGRGIKLLQFLVYVGTNFFSHDAFLRATALSFTTVLSLVPLLALCFSVLKGLGAQNKLAPWIINQMAAGSEVVVARIITYIGNTNMSSVGAIGVAALIYTSISMLSSIEDAFNAVWGVRETRTFYRKFSDYLSVLVSAPILLLAATSIATTLQSPHLLGWFFEYAYLGDLFLFLLSLIPYLTVWAAFFLLYLFIPNTRVRYTSALIGAVLAGTLWELAQWIYIHFQVGAARYNAIYGTLAALPILMVWIYTSWIIVLFGMEVVAAHQHRRTFRRDIRGEAISHSLRELVALAALRHIVEAFEAGDPGWNDEQLALRLRVPLRVMSDILSQLVASGFIVQTEGIRGPYYPAKEPDRVPLADLVLGLRGHGASAPIPGEEQAAELLRVADRAVVKAFEGLTMKDLVSLEKFPPGVDKGGPVAL
ncbi:hypothetical protein GMSM_32450 [Geomonas sp. Red276]